MCLLCLPVPEIRSPKNLRQSDSRRDNKSNAGRKSRQRPHNSSVVYWTDLGQINCLDGSYYAHSNTIEESV